MDYNTLFDLQKKFIFSNERQKTQNNKKIKLLSAELIFMIS